jgi:hypothetical protein
MIRMGEIQDGVGLLDEAMIAPLPRYVEIMLAAGDIQAARMPADELAALTGDLDAPMLTAIAAQAADRNALQAPSGPK